MSQNHPSKEIVGTRGKELEGTRVVLCVAGSIAALEAPEVARELMRHGADVWAVVSPSAKKIVHPQALEWATGNPVIQELTGKLEHISVLEGGRVIVLVAPATANTVAKVAHGIDDTPVTTVLSVALGRKVPIIFAPAMHEPMYENPFVAESLERLKQRGVRIVPPRIEEGKAKIAAPADILKAVTTTTAQNSALKGRRLLITAGPTMESIDPVRVITNRSTGRMGLAIAEQALTRGAEVTIVLGPTSLSPAPGAKIVRVHTTSQMKDAVEQELGSWRYDAVVASAAPADYTPVSSFEDKISTRTVKHVQLALRPTEKVIQRVKSLAPQCVLVAFKAEHHLGTRELLERGSSLMQEVAADMIVANDVSKEGAGFAADDIEAFLITDKHHSGPIRLSKREMAAVIIEEIEKRLSAAG